MLLVSAKIGPFRSMGLIQTVAVDPEVTVFVGMNEAGKTVILKALEKSADALQQEGFDVVEDYPRKDLTVYLKKHKAEPAAVTVLTYSLDDDEVSLINSKLGTSISNGFTFTVTHKYDNQFTIDMSVDEEPAAKLIVQNLSTDAAATLDGVN
jgi:predicted ATP-binding protein involved in virulence